MAKKPALTLVGRNATHTAPPRKLGKHGLALWSDVCAEYRIDDRGGIELLAQACAALDRAEALAEHIGRDGEVVRTTRGPRTHPSIKDELACRAFLVKTLQRLGINVEVIKPVGRPSTGLGWVPPEGWKPPDAD